MPTENKKNIENKIEKKIVKDEGFVEILGKPYKVNQGSPDIETMNKSIELISFNADYGRIVKVIDVFNSALDKLLIDGYNEDFIKSLDNLENKIKEQKSNLSNLFSKANDLFKDVLSFYLGKSSLDIVSSLGFIELIELVSKCNEQNKYIKANLHKA